VNRLGSSCDYTATAFALGEAVRWGRLFWPWLVLTTIGPVDAQNTSPGKPLDILPHRTQGRLWGHPHKKPRPAFRKTNPTHPRNSDRPEAAECQEQAMKLDADEKRSFLRECMSGKR